ncbi:MAG: Gx transporter family protein [Oscillospiraceae bacterium]|nr:Gx transporter family protein [Oscillospiraceae bacterium]
MKTKKLAECAVLAALAFGLSYIELLMPLPTIPGAKLGLANLAVLIALYRIGFSGAAAVSGVRILLSWLLFGNFTALVYSACGAVLSLLVMYLLVKSKLLSCVTVSAVGGACHNIGQIIAACFMLSTSAALSYLPYLVILGVLFGLVIGVLVKAILKVVSKKRT